MPHPPPLSTFPNAAVFCVFCSRGVWREGCEPYAFMFMVRMGGCAASSEAMSVGDGGGEGVRGDRVQMSAAETHCQCFFPMAGWHTWLK